MIGVTKATPLDGHALQLEFTDGLAGEVDCSFLLEGGLGKALEDPDYFKKVAVDPELRTVVWPNGLDPAPELLHQHLKTAGHPVSSAA